MASIKYVVGNNWDSGFTGEMTLTAGGADLQGWTVEFDSTATIISLWNAGIVSHVGSHYVVKNEASNAQVLAGQSVSFGFQASPGSGGTAASGFAINGVAADPPGLLPSLSIADASVIEGNSGMRDLAFTVALSTAATGPVTVAYATADGSAMAGSDYVAANGTLTFATGETSKVIHVQANGDTTVEADETLKVTLSSPSGAEIARATGTGTIVDDDGSLTGTFAVADAWNDGFSGTIDVKNGGAARTNWHIELDMPYQITNLWNARIISQDATGYVIGNVDWNGLIGQNGDTVFGFTASGAFNPSAVYVHGIGEAVTSIPTVPTGLLAAAITSNSAWLSWAPSTVQGNAPVTYTIFENGQQIAMTTDVSYTVANLSAGTTYQFAVAALDAAGSSAATSPLSVQTAAVGTGFLRMFSPYIDMGFPPDAFLSDISAKSGVQNFTLAFVVANGTQIGWGGLGGGITDDTVWYDHKSTTIQAQVKAIQAKGGHITISFGGQIGTEMALVTSIDAKTLQTDYQSVIDRYGIDSIDFDIEGAAISDKASILKRDQAIVGLERANPGLKVSFTLPVTPKGLEDAPGRALDLLKDAKKDGVRVDTVNIMAMDYYDPAYDKISMGQNAITAAQGTEQQIAALGLGAKLGITPMIGVNDDHSEIFYQSDAHALLDYAKTDPNVVQLGMWSMSRDDGKSSGITQNPYEFSGVFKTFDHTG